MTCPHCGTPATAGARFCQVCGAPLTAETPPGPRVTRALGNPPIARGGPLVADAADAGRTIQLGDLRITVEGDLVPVANVELGTQHTIYFEHHILLWKDPGVTIGYRGRKGMARRFFAGTPIFLSEARGPGNIAVSRESVGQVVALPLAPGAAIDVREHQFLLATSTVDYEYASLGGVANALFTRSSSRTGLFVDRFSGRGESGLVLLHGYGNVFEKLLEPDEMLDVEPGGWLWKDTTVRVNATSLVGAGHGGMVGALSNMMSGGTVALNRFTGPGRVGIQSMTLAPREVREAGEPRATGTAAYPGMPGIPGLGEEY
jgi:uncharacterized protein (AIM24 family)